MPKRPSEPPETEVKPAPKLEKRKRRTFTVEYKLRIIEAANACKHGELGPLLRREKIYSNQLSDWRREFAEHGVAGLEKSTPGPSAQKTPEQREIAKLKQQIAQLNDKLLVAQDCIDIQKKYCRFSIIRTMGIRREPGYRMSNRSSIDERCV